MNGSMKRESADTVLKLLKRFVDAPPSHPQKLWEAIGELLELDKPKGFGKEGGAFDIWRRNRGISRAKREELLQAALDDRVLNYTDKVLELEAGSTSVTVDRLNSVYFESHDRTNKNPSTFAGEERVRASSSDQTPTGQGGAHAAAANLSQPSKKTKDNKKQKVKTEEEKAKSLENKEKNKKAFLDNLNKKLKAAAAMGITVDNPLKGSSGSN